MERPTLFWAIRVVYFDNKIFENLNTHPSILPLLSFSIYRVYHLAHISYHSCAYKPASPLCAYRNTHLWTPNVIIGAGRAARVHGGGHRDAQADQQRRVVDTQAVRAPVNKVAVSQSRGLRFLKDLGWEGKMSI